MKTSITWYSSPPNTKTTKTTNTRTPPSRSACGWCHHCHRLSPAKHCTALHPQSHQHKRKVNQPTNQQPYNHGFNKRGLRPPNLTLKTLSRSLKNSPSSSSQLFSFSYPPNRFEKKFVGRVGYEGCHGQLLSALRCAASSRRSYGSSSRWTCPRVMGWYNLRQNGSDHLLWSDTKVAAVMGLVAVVSPSHLALLKTPIVQQAVLILKVTVMTEKECGAVY